MKQEIERKFLVNGDFKSLAYDKHELLQGYLSADPKRTVRIRIKGDRGYLTIKGISSSDGTSRQEWEKEFSSDEIRALVPLCMEGLIEKTRYLVKSGRHIFEVDEFYGENAGLIVAEIELEKADEEFEKPDWLGEEVTGDKRYYNLQLSLNPYKNWSKE